MQSLVLAIEDVDDAEPPVFVFGCELELLTVVPGVGTLAQFLDILNGDLVV